MSTYLYLDDEPKAAVNAYIRAVQTEVTGLTIRHAHPKPYHEEIDEIVSASKDASEINKLDGLILDLRLDLLYQDDDTTQDKANYRAATLAQEIRTRATEGDIPPFPIVLWSTNAKLRKSYDADDTSHNLFDLKSVKADIEEPAQARRVAKQLLSLVTGYARISRLRKSASTAPFEYLGFSAEPVFLDSRIYANLVSSPEPLPAHEYARFIIRELLESAGPLVNEWILAARLGIDLEKSPGFQEVVEKLFSNAAYNGPFGEGWPNWWFALVEDAWRTLPNCPGLLRSTPAEARVDLLKQVTGVTTIVAAAPALLSERATFWTICHATLRPLDPRDGYLIDKQPKYQWQDREYVSFSAILNKEAESKKIRIDALEQERYKRTKSKLSV